MEYGQFVVRAFEQQPGKWRAKVRRVDGAPIKITSRKKLHQFTTGVDLTTEADAILMAISAIDAKAFSRISKHTEKFWRCQQHSNSIALLTPEKIKSRR